MQASRLSASAFTNNIHIKIHPIPPAQQMSGRMVQVINFIASDRFTRTDLHHLDQYAIK